VLADLVASWVAQQIIMYDMSGYTTRTEAQTMLDVLENNIRRAMQILEEDKNKTYLGIS
jgi:hypothetical protein